MFSAVALIAFSFAGMANNETTNEVKEVNKKSVMVKNGCMDLAYAVLDYVDPDCEYSNMEGADLVNYVYALCVK